MELERINRVYTNAAVESEHAYYSFDRPPMIPKTAIMLNELSDLVLKGMEAKERFKKEFKVSAYVKNFESIIIFLKTLKGNDCIVRELEHS